MSLWIPACSPLFFYSPDAVYFSGSNYTSSWTANTTTGSSTNDTYMTATPAAAAAVVLPFMFASALTPYWTAPPSINVTLAVDEDDAVVWASGETWTDDFHATTFEWDIVCDGLCAEGIQFWGVEVDTQFVPAGTAENMTLDDASAYIAYDGFAALPASQSSSVTPTASDYMSTLSMAATIGATLSFSFRGAAVLLTGLTSPYTGAYTVTLDGTTMAFTSYRNVTTHGVPLFFETGLDTRVAHSLVLTTTDASEAVGFVLDSVSVFGNTGALGIIYADGDAPTTLTSTGAAIADAVEAGAIALTTVTAVEPTATAAVTTVTAVQPTTAVTGAAATTITAADTTATAAEVTVTVAEPTATTVTAAATTSAGAFQSGVTSTATGSPSAGAVVGIVLGVLVGLGALGYGIKRCYTPFAAVKTEKKRNSWDVANDLQNMKNEKVLVTTAAKDQRYVYPGLIALSKLK
ncbi:hypothetical protein Q5752_000446 [Cryptotrichosporon argae]